ncbi:HD domain-containing protein [Patescibacteria group bacterium]|nr:HD domain-containing protein [Patescibacteria group bacterium]
MQNNQLVTFNDLLESIKRNNIIIDFPLLKNAYSRASIAHSNTFRNTGEEYIYHPLAVANILVSLKLDGNTIIAAILHDIIEDTDITLDNIKEEFGEDIARIVDGVTKISRLTDNSDSDNQNFENVRKFLIASSEDIRIVILKLVDRLHNIYTIRGLPKTKQKSYAKETMNIYSPLAEYLGMNSLKAQLDDICFSILCRKEYHIIQSFLEKEIKDFEIFSDKFINHIKKELDKNLVHYEIFGRRKNIYSIYKKVLRLNGYFDISYISKLNDLIAFTILVDNVEMCYKTLGIIHTLFQYISSEFDDYIARPKPNGFKTLQTSVYAFDDRIVEIQIKTYEMHEYNEYGPASHIAYKLKGNSSSNISNKFLWIKNLVLWRNNDNHSDLDIFKNRIYVLTPKGFVKELEKDSTPIDFAYMVHTQVGNSMIGAKVNGKMVSLDYKLQTGDVVEILVSKNKFLAHSDWVDIAKMSSVKQKIRRFLREKEDTSKIEEVKEEVHTSPISKIKIIKKEKASKQIGINIEGVNDIPTKFAKCCNPMPFDKILGYISMEGTVIIHKNTCSNVADIAKDKFVKAQWDKVDISDKSYFAIKLLLEGFVEFDINKILEKIKLLDLKILNISSEIKDEKFNIFLNIDILNSRNVSDIINNLQFIEGVELVRQL